ncbi:hypothetical protein AURDEDRAFT_61186 [Auricularia subglabra TFB-10046 SS5]|nr:hypothetical protein AURDEDRAFT_61186 [Auricularia subglabra TFB-10046 SS5]
MPVLSLPQTFANSFWSQDYRKGLQVLYGKLEQGIDESAEIVSFIRTRAAAERTLGQALAMPGPPDRGFGADDGASLLVTFRCLQSDSITQGKAHLALAKELDTVVADPFEEWAHAHKGRVHQSRNVLVDGWLQAYEDGVAEVAKLKKNYLNKTRKADEAEDDAKFAPNYNAPSDPYTASPKINQSHGVVQRTPSVSERISQRLAELQRKKPGSNSPTTSEKAKSDDGEEEEAPRPSVDKGKGKAIEPQSPLPMSPPPMSPPLPPAKFSSSPAPANVIPPPPLPMLLAGVSMQPADVSKMLLQAQTHLPLRSVRFPFLGEYQELFTGEEFATWLVENVPAFGGNLDLAEEAARELTERDNVLRRIGEFGNKFENSDDAFYQFRPKAFDLAGEHAARKGDIVGEPTSPTPMPLTARLVKRSGTLVNFVSNVITSNASGEPPHVKARAEALEASQAYRSAVRQLDRRRLGLEERIEETLKALQKWELDRLRAAKTVLAQYQAALGALHPQLKEAVERSTELVAGFRPENDLVALIERYRTGPFRPCPQKFESAAHTVADVVFGIDLSSWAGEGGWNAVRAQAGDAPKDTIPPVLRGLLAGMEEAYKKLPNDAERRKAWIYEVPLPATHHLRESINSLPPNSPLPAELLEKYDPPVIASAVKLWLLELEPPLGTWEGWEEVRKIYPNVGADTKPEEIGALAHVDDLKNVLYRLPKVHLYVLDALVQHFNALIESTPEVEEEKDVYVTKLALSVGRTILRPKVESEMAIQDRHPTLFFMDLLKYYAETLPPTITRKKRESERPIPVKKRTAPIDLRMSRSRLSAQGLDPNVVMAQISHSRSASRSRAGSASQPPVPPIPVTVASVLSEPIIHPPPPAPAQQDPDAPPPRPVFAEPKDDDEDVPQELTIQPPTPRQAASPPLAGSGANSPAPGTPTAEGDQVLATTPTTGLSRSSSGGVGGPRGPRPTRGPRAAPSSGSLARPSHHVRTGSSASISDRPHSPADPREYTPKGKKVGRVQASAFSRRTMASDAEDEVVDK